MHYCVTCEHAVYCTACPTVHVVQYRVRALVRCYLILCCPGPWAMLLMIHIMYSHFTEFFSSHTWAMIHIMYSHFTEFSSSHTRAMLLMIHVMYSHFTEFSISHTSAMLVMIHVMYSHFTEFSSIHTWAILLVACCTCRSDSDGSNQANVVKQVKWSKVSHCLTLWSWQSVHLT